MGDDCGEVLQVGFVVRRFLQNEAELVACQTPVCKINSGLALGITYDEA